MQLLIRSLNKNSMFFNERECALQAEGNLNFYAAEFQSAIPLLHQSIKVRVALFRSWYRALFSLPLLFVPGPKLQVEGQAGITEEVY